MFSRGIMIGRDLWQYSIGDTSVVIRCPDGKRHLARLKDVTGHTDEKLKELKETQVTDKICPASAVRRYIYAKLMRQGVCDP